MKNVLLLFVLGLVACNQSSDSAPMYEAPYASSKMEAESVPANGADYEVKRLDLQLRVASLAEAEKRVKTQLSQLGGSVAGHVLHEGHVSSAHMTLQLPVKQLDAWMKWLDTQEGWELSGSQWSSTSIQQQYVDHEQRLITRQALEKRYTELLQKAQNMADVLAIEEKLVGLRTEIEWMQSEKGRMDDQLIFAECSLRLEEHPSAWKRLQQQAVRHWREGWDVLVNLILFLLRIWPLLVLAGFGSWWYRLRKRKSKAF